MMGIKQLSNFQVLDGNSYSTNDILEEVGMKLQRTLMLDLEN